MKYRPLIMKYRPQIDLFADTDCSRRGPIAVLLREQSVSAKDQSVAAISLLGGRLEPGLDRTRYAVKTGAKPRHFGWVIEKNGVLVASVTENFEFFGLVFGKLLLSITRQLRFDACQNATEHLRVRGFQLRGERATFIRLEIGFQPVYVGLFEYQLSTLPPAGGQGNCGHGSINFEHGPPPAKLLSDSLNLFLNLVNLVMAKQTREPLQVYLTEEERTELDRLAAAMGVSGSEALRRGVAALAPRTLATGPLAALAEEGLVTPARLEPGEAPAGRPVAPLCDLLDELRADRDGR